MKYLFNEIEQKWQQYWAKNHTFKAEDRSEKPKFYVLDMFPYPSGAGLHVGHPLGYIASDIYARFKRHEGYNVLHPQGYDSFGLPAEQYAIQTGQHPAITTETNIKRYREQLDKMGFSFDWSRELRTSDPSYYQWTQWIFIQLFESWYNIESDTAAPIADLIHIFEETGNTQVQAVCDENVKPFTSEQWRAYSEEEKENILLKYRLTYLAEAEVNWCPALGTVLANDEVVNGVSERGGYPVIRKKMTQWSMRITAYAERLLKGLDTIDWPEPLKESQRNWIGRSKGASVRFQLDGSEADIEVFTTRPDTIFGVTFMTLAPEHELVSKITTDAQREAVNAYVEATARRSERERMADVKSISGVFTGAYALHPFTGDKIPVWIGDYVLAGYGTGAVMAVPCGDQRDHDFANYFAGEPGMPPVKNIFKGVDVTEEAFNDKETTIIANSDFLNGLAYEEATQKAIEKLEALGRGEGKINYRLRDAVFSRQRYWGEPFPVYYVNGMPRTIAFEHLPLELPEVEKYLPTETGEPPLGNAEIWAWDTRKNKVVQNTLINEKEGVYPLELNTMPGWAGSSWYFNRYMDPHNPEQFVSQEAVNYWKDVDLYIGGSEHATGHLLYSRFWQKFLFDRGWVPVEEYARKLINQGMILGTSAFVYRISGSNKLVSKGLKDAYTTEAIHADITFVNSSDELDIDAFKKWRPEFANAEFLLENGRYIVGREPEKMSKSKYNVVNPDDICEQYGADTLRLYEMFLGPLEQAKPWNTSGISGVFGFLKKLWKLYHNSPDGSFSVSEEAPPAAALKTLHKTIKKVKEDIENFSFNTSVSSFMIAVNELTAQKCNHRAILEPLAITISPYAPHIAEELWEKLGHEKTIAYETFPAYDEKYLVESTKEYPVSFNGKMRFKIELSLDLDIAQVEKAVLEDERTQKQLNGRTPKKVIVVHGKIVNVVG
ncbi:leucine--tRNA ligase [Ascidiimonas aurantiaca]|uniref:leucine--tRNA ligase n=1 Tax=Ascidiimonas aurantiaca TaxID=1685432 RepID=UPI0030ECB8FF